MFSCLRRSCPSSSSPSRGKQKWKHQNKFLNLKKKKNFTNKITEKKKPMEKKHKQMPNRKISVCQIQLCVINTPQLNYLNSVTSRPKQTNVIQYRNHHPNYATIQNKSLNKGKNLLLQKNKQEQIRNFFSLCRNKLG